jgi:hypothetical protein
MVRREAFPGFHECLRRPAQVRLGGSLALDTAISGRWPARPWPCGKYSTRRNYFRQAAIATDSCEKTRNHVPARNSNREPANEENHAWSLVSPVSPRARRGPDGCPGRSYVGPLLTAGRSDGSRAVFGGIRHIAVQGSRILSVGRRARPRSGSTRSIGPARLKFPEPVIGASTRGSVSAVVRCARLARLSDMTCRSSYEL